MESLGTKNLEEHLPVVVSACERGGNHLDSGQLAGDQSGRGVNGRQIDEDRRSVKGEAIDHFAAQIAHDLNNVLNTICGYGALAQGRLAPGETSRYIDNVVRASERARALAQQLLNGCREGLDPETLVCIERTVGEVLEWVAIILPKGVQLQMTLGAGKAYVLADPTQLSRIVMNLCTNCRARHGARRRTRCFTR
jgi:two-component system cell cycle sensor histidine kinase/response regulator CckA